MSQEQQNNSGLLSRRKLVKAGAVTAAASAFSFNIGGRAKAATGTVTLYHTMPPDLAAKMAAAFAKTPQAKDGLSIVPFFANGFELYARAQAEYASGRVKHDIIMLTDPGLFIELKKNNRLYGYVSPELPAYPAAQRDPDGYWCNGRTVLTIYGYNTRAVPDGATRYKKWADFADPKLAAGQVCIIDALQSPSTFQNYYALRMNKDLGRKFWETVAALQPTITPTPGQVTSMNISGQVSVGINNDYFIYQEKVTNGANARIAPVYPTEVIAATIIPLAVVKNCPNPDGAKVVYDWWLSKDGQTAIRDINYIYSPRNDVPPLPGLPKFEDLPIYVASAEELQKVTPDLQKEFKEIFKL